MPTALEQVLRLGDIDSGELATLLDRYQLRLEICPAQQPIPGSYWGDDEAGLLGDRLYARPDTPVHSILHETSHYICMDAARRICLDTNAMSDNDEENAVCYLQILLADHLDWLGKDRILLDMDRWGYSFRLGSSRAWFEDDADDARRWLIQHQIIDSAANTRFRLRQNC
jgi:hypothetical protein